MKLNILLFSILFITYPFCSVYSKNARYVSWRVSVKSDISIDTSNIITQSDSIFRKELINVIEQNIPILNPLLDLNNAIKEGLSGNFIVIFTVNKKGTVDTCFIKSSTLDNKTTDQQIINWLLNINFKKELIKEESVHVQLPFNYSTYRQRSKDAILEVIMDNYDSLKKLYNGRLGENPQLKGRVTVRLVIETSGKVKRSAISRSTTNDIQFENEVQNWINSLCFDKHNRETTVFYTLYFNNRSGFNIPGIIIGSILVIIFFVFPAISL